MFQQVFPSYFAAVMVDLEPQLLQSSWSLLLKYATPMISSMTEVAPSLDKWKVTALALRIAIAAGVIISF